MTISQRFARASVIACGIELLLIVVFVRVGNKAQYGAWDGAVVDVHSYAIGFLHITGMASGVKWFEHPVWFYIAVFLVQTVILIPIILAILYIVEVSVKGLRGDPQNPQSKDVQ